jgi:hypothetical protein
MLPLFKTIISCNLSLSSTKTEKSIRLKASRKEELKVLWVQVRVLLVDSEIKLLELKSNFKTRPTVVKLNRIL